MTKTKVRQGRGVMTNKKFVLMCIKCGKIFQNRLNYRCDVCNSLVDSVYNIEYEKEVIDAGNISRYISMLPINTYDEGFEILYNIPVTPIIKMRYKNVEICVKDESKLPTGTTKDRMAVITLIQMLNAGVKDFVVSSTGNSSSAFLYYSNLLKGKIRCHVFGDAKYIHRVRYDNVFAENYPIVGDYVLASKKALEFAKGNGYYWEGGFFNYARREGLKTAYLEGFEQMDYVVDAVVQMVSSGMGIVGGYKGVNELVARAKLRYIPKFYCVQQDTCMPMIRAYLNNEDEITDKYIVYNPVGLAKEVLRGDSTNSYPYIKDIVERTKGEFISVSQATLIKMQMYLVENNVDAGYAGTGSFAAAISLIDRGIIKENQKILVMMTGRKYE